MENIQRPSIEETDADLILQQKNFLKGKQKVSDTHDDLIKHKSTPTNIPKDSDPVHIKNNMDINDSDFVIHSKDVVFDVKEYEVSVVEPFVFAPPTSAPLDVELLLKKKPKQSQYSAKKASKSIFAQLVEEELEISTPDNAKVPECSSLSSDINSKFSSKANSELNENERKTIHDENLTTLSSMSKEEILQFQKELQNKLDPKLVNFIKNRSKRQAQLNSDKVHTSKIGTSTDKMILKRDEDFGTVLRKEGRGDCDALILQKAISEEQFTSIEGNHPEINYREKNQNLEIPPDTQKLLEESKGRWENMHKIEKEKLAWMSELPQPKPVDLKTGCTARFDFEGNLLLHDVETPTYKGLHHHSAEPEVAGYSLEELFLLARSSLQSQRITALHTIAHILDKYWYGLMDDCFDEAMLPMMLQAGLVPLLRWALDDTSLTSIAATITAIHSLLICKPDETCLQRTFTWLNGHITPQLEPLDLIEPNVIIEELTDADLIKLDVIKGFLRIDVLPRFMYILQSMHPPPLVCKLIIEICAHFAQHSTESATLVAAQPGLLKFIFEKFLPLSWKFIDGSKLSNCENYCCPVPAAMKLMRIIASSDKDLALCLADMHLFSNILLYLTIQPVDNKIPLLDFQLLIIETLKIFHTFLSYGLGIQIFLDLFPILLKHMDFCLSLDLNAEKSKHFQDFDYATHLFKVLEAIALNFPVEQNHNTSFVSALNAFFKKSLSCLKKWLWQVHQDNPSDHGVNLLAACLNFISTYTEKTHVGLTCENWKPCSEVKEAFNDYFLPCIKSDVFRKLLQDIESFSHLLRTDSPGSNRDSKTLISLGSVQWKSDIVPPLKEKSPIPLLLAVLNFAIVHIQLFRDAEHLILKEFIKQEPLMSYLKEISSKKLNSGSWFSMIESYFLFKLLHLLSIVSQDSMFVHSVAANLLSTLKAPYECLVVDMFDNIIFNKDMLLFSIDEIVDEVCGKLPIISKCYSSFFFDSKVLCHSNNLIFNHLVLESQSFPSQPQYLLTKDWIYTPIFKTYQGSLKKKSNEELSTEKVLLLNSCLQWVYTSQKLNLSAHRSIPSAVKFCYLSMVYLLDESYFLNPYAKSLLGGCLSLTITEKKLHLLKIKWDTISSYEDLYLEVLNQFEAVSYGDELFCNVIIYPLQQGYPSQWKKVLLTEHSQILRFLRISLSKVLVPLQNLLYPTENDIDVISEYQKLLITGTLTHTRSPVIYLMAIHHIHNFLFTRNKELLQSQKELFTSLMLSQNKAILKQILLYSTINIEDEYGFELETTLSLADQEHLNNVNGNVINFSL